MNDPAPNSSQAVVGSGTLSEKTLSPKVVWAMRTLVVLLVAYFIWNSLYYAPYTVDDAFITLRYAENLVSGRGLVYNPGEHVEGYSNFSWVILEAFLLRMHLPVLTCIKCVELLSGIGVVILTFVLGRRLFAMQEFRTVKCLLAVGLMALNTSLAVWSQAGLETTFWTLLVVAMCLRYETELKLGRPFPWSAILFGLAWLTRPELPIYGLYFLIRRALAGPLRARLRADLWWIATASLLIVPYEIWGLWYFGRLLPNTHLAKVGEVSLGGLPDVVRWLSSQKAVVKFLTWQGWGFPALLSLGAVGCVVGRKSLRPALWLVPLCGLMFVLYAKNDWMPRHRYFVPMLPFICLLVAYGLGELLRLVRKKKAWMLVWCVVCGTLCVDYCRAQMFGGEYKRNPKWRTLAHGERGFWFFDVPENATRRNYPLQSTALFILANVPPNETVCLRDIGFPGFLSMNPIWDTAGLITPAAARVRRDGSDEVQEMMFEELLEIQPACFVLMPASKAAGADEEIYTWLETNAVARSRYKCVDNSNGTAVYLRRNLDPVDPTRRLRAAMIRFPEYSQRLSVTSAGTRQPPARK
jgi:hypothetical protein